MSGREEEGEDGRGTEASFTSEPITCVGGGEREEREESIRQVDVKNVCACQGGKTEY